MEDAKNIERVHLASSDHNIQEEEYNKFAYCLHETTCSYRHFNFKKCKRLHENQKISTNLLSIYEHSLLILSMSVDVTHMNKTIVR